MHPVKQIVMLKNTKGILFALGAAIALANSFIFSKAALNEISMLQFGLIWFAMGTVWNLGYIFFSSNRKAILQLKKTAFWAIFVVAILEAVASGLFYIAIQKVENPAIVAFVGAMGPVFVTLMGIIILKEKYKPYQLAGIVIALVGVVILAYNKQAVSQGILIPGTEYVLMASFLFAIATITARKFRDGINPALLALLRAGMLFMAFVVLAVYFSIELTVSSSALLNMGIGSFLEGLLTMVFAYNALKYIEAAKTSLLISTKSIFVLLSAWLFLHVFPANYQLFGGALTIVGVIMLNWKKTK